MNFENMTVGDAIKLNKRKGERCNEELIGKKPLSVA